jgi:hypothetical protein
LEDEKGGFVLDELHKAHLEKKVVSLLPQREKVFYHICFMELEVGFCLWTIFLCNFV